MRQVLALTLIIGVFAIGAFGLTLMACGHGFFADLCRTASVFCGTAACPADASAFMAASFHLNAFRDMSLGVLLLGLLMSLAVAALAIFAIPETKIRNWFAVPPVASQPRHQRLAHWLKITQKRDPAR